MIRTRLQLEQTERNTLEPYATFSGDTLGREYPESPHPYRTHFQRDRSRVIHSKAFRRLENKTQVFLSGSGDHLRNRLTHTIEVASVSRTIARALGLNEDLAEAIALAHDLGHSPFGHSGEEKLNQLMRGAGGFEHNVQSLRVVRVLEEKYPAFPGLNLSREVLEGLDKHRKFHQDPGGHPEPNRPSLEAQIANLADEITYYSHDLEDGLDFNLLNPARIASLEVWTECHEIVRNNFPKLKGRELNGYVIRTLLDREVENVIATSAAAIRESGVGTADDVRRHPHPLIQYSGAFVRKNREMRKFLYANLYYHPEVAGANRRACDLLGDVFSAYKKNPALLGRRATARIRREGLERTLCDYLSGMTDLYLIEEHRKLFPSRHARRRVRRVHPG